MTKLQLIEKAAKSSGMTKKEITDAYNALSEAFCESLVNGESVQISGIGTFAVRERAAHNARNPRTGEQIEIPAARRVVFTVGKALKDKVNEA